MVNQTEPIQVNTDTPAVPVFDTDDLTQIAKFLDALLEADIANKSNERKQGNEEVLSHSSNDSLTLTNCNIALTVNAATCSASWVDSARLSRVGCIAAYSNPHPMSDTMP